MLEIIIAIFYQPFLNALVLVYWALGHVMADPDMGVAVIVFTVLIRILLLPLSIASNKSEDEKRVIGRKYQELREKYENNEPLVFQKKKRELIQEHQPTIRFEFINLAVQLVIAIILWRVFTHGLEGEDLHLLYSWIPNVTLPFNLTFLHLVDLTKPSLMMNFLSSSLMFVVETLSLTFSPIPPSKEDRLVQFLLPVIVFVYLYTMPAGKKFFVVTTLAISILMMMTREIGGLIELSRSQRK